MGLRRYKYLDAQTWHILSNAAFGWEAVKSAVARRCVQMGLLRPSAYTVASMLATVYAARVDESQFHGLDMGEALRAVRELGESVRMARTRAWPSHDMIMRFPDVPSQLLGSHPELFRAMFGDAGPRPTGINPVMCDELRTRIPCRCTRTEVSDAPAKRRRQHAQPSAVPGDIGVETGFCSWQSAFGVGLRQLAVPLGCPRCVLKLLPRFFIMGFCLETPGSSLHLESGVGLDF